MHQESAVELRPRRRRLVLSGLAGIGVAAYAVWAGGIVAWLGVALGAILIAGNGYWLIRGKSRVSLSQAGIEWAFEWSRRGLAWADVESMRERPWGSNISGLEQSAQAVLALVEQFSGREVERVR